MIKGVIKLKEHHDRGSKHNMMIGGESNMLADGAENNELI